MYNEHLTTDVDVDGALKIMAEKLTPAANGHKNGHKHSTVEPPRHHGLNDVETVLAMEQARLRVRRENEELRRQNEVLVETLNFMQETVDSLENQLKAAKEAQHRAEEHAADQQRLREVSEWETGQLQERLDRAVEIVANERSKGLLQRLRGR